MHSFVVIFMYCAFLADNKTTVTENIVTVKC